MSLKDVRGQEAAMRVLTGAMSRGRLASAYLFAGEQGIGKRLTAMNFAKALNCQGPASDGGGFADSCDRCPSCRKIEAGAHPDVLVLAPEGGASEEGGSKGGAREKKHIIRVDEIRRLLEALSLKPHEARTRVAVVDDAETMNDEAANAFLKTLEEPSATDIIILVSSAPDLLPETVRSRCSRVNFRPLPTSACAELITEKAMGKRPAPEGGGAEALALLSMGRPGLALEGGLLAERDRFLDALGRMLGIEDKPTWKNREEIERWLDMAMLFLRDAAVMGITGDRGALINGDRPEVAAKLSARRSPEVIIDCYERLLAVRRAMGFSLNKGITWNYAGSLMGELIGDG
jgi:DNA polymerase-3 subunit delta'